MATSPRRGRPPGRRYARSMQLRIEADVYAALSAQARQERRPLVEIVREHLRRAVGVA